MEHDHQLDLPEINYDELKDHLSSLIKKSKINLDVLLSRLQIDPKQTLNVYLIGSRLWGTATYDSDYDFLIVLRKWEGKASLHSGEIDATVYDLEEFKKRLADHSFHELVTIWIPREFVWKEVFNPKSDFNLSPKKLELSILEETDRDWRMAKKYLEKGNLDRTKKTIVHAFRLLLFSLQIMDAGVINDYHVTVKFSKQLEYVYEQDWSYYENFYEPLFNRMRESLTTKVKRNKDF